jgi:methyl-accepting chemotaxis protein
MPLLTKGDSAALGNNLASLTTSALTVIIAGLVYYLARLNRPRTIEAGSYLLTGFWSLIIFASLLIGAFSPITIAAFILPLICAGLLVTPKQMLVWTLVLEVLLTIAFGLTLGATHPAAENFNSTTASVSFGFFFILLLIVGGGLAYLQYNVGSVLNELERRLKELAQLSQDREQKRQFGEEISTRLKSMTAELNATSLQQSTRTHQQASTVLEITTSLNELGETSRQIATNSKSVTQMALEGQNSASEVTLSAEQANANALRGEEAVAAAVQAIEEVRHGITGLAQRLMVLTEQSRQITSIVGLIKEVADETHLLALNAAIESAGSGQNGQRFGVVAAEIKNLADRALGATGEIEQIVGELQGAVSAAVLASEETRKKTYGAVERSYQAGKVINDLREVVSETALKVEQIAGRVAEVVNLAAEISYATQQQDSAVQQIILSMGEIGLVARENASAVSQVSEMVSEIDQLSNQLNQALNSQPVLQAA